MLSFRPPLDRPLRRPEYIRAMRDMLFVGGFAMPYGTIVGVAGPIFAGLMLQMGIEKAAIGLILSFAQITGLVQMVSFRLTDMVHPRKLVIGVGTIEILMTIVVISVPLWVPIGWRFPAVVVLIILAWSAAQTHVPTFNSWFASIIPADLRGRYISKRTFIQYVVGIATSLIAGRFIDLVPGYIGFAILYGVALVFGLATYWVLYATPLPQLSSTESDEVAPESHFGRLMVPLRNPEYRRFITFNIVWTLVIAMPGPYYNVFMIDGLKISYSTIAIFTSAQMIVMGVGFRFWGIIVDRFGGKPMIELLFIPTIVMPSLWALARPESYWIVPIAMILGGLGFSGLSIANSIMLYAIIPQQGSKSSYFAIWSISIGVASALAPAVGSAVIAFLDGFEMTVFDYALNRYHLLFILTSICGVFPGLLITRLPRLGADRPMYMISQLTRGNPFSLAYNFFLLGRVNQPTKRANLIRSLGRSRSPLALEKLIASLENPDPEIRRSAALALGDSGQPKAMQVLIAHMNDPQSDVRDEAARALGMLGDDAVVPHLIAALDDADTELRAAAAESLARILIPEARDALVEKLNGPFDRALFPIIFEGLSRGHDGSKIGDLRMVRPAARVLPDIGSHALRLQVTNAIARALGIGDEYSRLIQQNPYDRDSDLHARIGRARRAVSELPWESDEVLGVVTTFERMALAQMENDIPTFIAHACGVAELICKRFSNGADEPTVISEGCAALRILRETDQLSALGDYAVIFTVLVIHRIIVAAQSHSA